MAVSIRPGLAALALLIAVCPTRPSTSAAVEPSADELAAAAKWVAARLDAKSAAGLPFSFVYDGKPSAKAISSWKSHLAARQLDNGRLERTITLADPKTGLTLRCVATVYRHFPAVEWVLHFRNAGAADTPILENVQAIHADLGTAVDPRPYTLHYAEGSHERITDFQPLERAIAPGGSAKLSSFGGRPSDGVLPLFNLAEPGGGGGGGMMIGIGWTGQWAASFARAQGGCVNVQAGMERTHLRLQPGEEIRTPAVLLLFWAGPDRMRGQNLLRRLLLGHYTPTPGAKPVDPPCAASPHVVVGFEQTTEENMVRAIRNIASHKLPIDTWWIDTGWFTCPNKPNGWAGAVGNPDPDPVRFPNGLKPVADAAHQAGMKFLLWFEPERVMRETWLFKNHPEWLLKPSNDLPAELQYHVRDGFHLLDLGNPAALAWVKGKISGMIRDVGIDVYRNDFNLYPLYFWRNGEAVDRQGIREIRYVTGLYDFFDALRRDHPHLLLDTCASGGRRIDFEMLRRALVLTRSDYLWDPIGQQCHTYGLAQWIPITGIGSDSPDLYKCRSGLGSHFALGADFYAKDPAVWESAARRIEEHRAVKHLYTGDYYPLGSYSTAGNVWMAWQFHRPDLGEGLVQAFRRQESPEATAVYRLRGLEPALEYAVTNLDEPKPLRLSGRELMERGLTIRLAGKPSAAVLTYKKAAAGANWP